MRWTSMASVGFCVLVTGCATVAGDGAAAVDSRDHYVTLQSTAPSHAGKKARLYVREVSPRGNARPAGVVLFVHGAGTPGYVGFDVPYKTYSWMGYLAKAGYAVYSVDLTGYGRSTRPQAMSDACNLSKAARAAFVPSLIAADCRPSHPTPMTTLDSDANDIDAVVEFLRRKHRVDQVALLGWSQAGPRTAAYVARFPGKVSRMFILAPAYARDMPSVAPQPLPVRDGNMGVQSEAALQKLWDSQVGCPDQYEPATRNAIWKQMIDSDPEGARWGPGVRRAPSVPNWGFNKTTVARIRTPYAMVAGQHDVQIVPTRVRDLYEDLGSSDKVFVDLACSSHNAMWEKNHLLLFQASLEWLKEGKVNGVSSGMVRMGY
jgi:pimeloyl-ACP methyl ester carboxylesterase